MLRSLDNSISNLWSIICNCSLEIQHSLFKNRYKTFCIWKEYWVQRSPSAVVLTFQLQRATKLTLKSTPHQEKSEAEESSSDAGLLRQHFPPYFSPTRATYKRGKQRSSNTGRELCYCEWHSVIQRSHNTGETAELKGFPPPPEF